MKIMQRNKLLTSFVAFVFLFNSVFPSSAWAADNNQQLEVQANGVVVATIDPLVERRANATRRVDQNANLVVGNGGGADFINDNVVVRVAEPVVDADANVRIGNIAVNAQIPMVVAQQRQLAAAVNNPPTLNVIRDVTLSQSLGVRASNLAGLTDGEGDTQGLTVTAVSSNLSVIESVVIGDNNVLYYSPTGTLGRASITVTVTDAGGATFSRSFFIDVIRPSRPNEIGVYEGFFAPDPNSADDLTPNSLDDWEMVSGNWHISNGKLVQVPTSSAHNGAMLLYNQPFSNHTSIRGPMLYSEGDSVGPRGFVLAYQIDDKGGSHYYLGLYDRESKKYTISRFDNGIETVLASIANPPLNAFISNRFALLNFTITADPATGDNKLTLSFNGRKVLEVRDATLPSSGRAGIFSNAPNPGARVLDVVYISSAGFLPPPVVNVAPVATAQTVTLDEDATQMEIVLAAVDQDGDPITYSIVQQPEFGTLVSDEGKWYYTPNTNFHGTDSFRFLASDGKHESATFYANGTTDPSIATVTLNISPVNDAPILSDIENKNVSTGTLLSFVIDGSDVDNDLSSLIYSATGLPDGASFNPETKTFSWIPSRAHAGTHSVTFGVTDGVAITNRTIQIIVATSNAPPIAQEQTVAFNEDLTQEIILTGTDLDDNDVLTYSVVRQPANGTLTPIAGHRNKFTYTPRANFNGTDSFEFQINDGHVNSTVAVVSLNITPVNDVSTIEPLSDALINQLANVVAGQPINFRVIGNDIDGDTLTYSVSGLPVLNTANVFNSTNGQFNWTPTTAGTYTLSFTANDSTPLSVTITVHPAVNPQMALVADDLHTLFGFSDTTPGVAITSTSPSEVRVDFSGAARTPVFNSLTPYSGANRQMISAIYHFTNGVITSATYQFNDVASINGQPVGTLMGVVTYTNGQATRVIITNPNAVVPITNPTGVVLDQTISAQAAANGQLAWHQFVTVEGGLSQTLKVADNNFNSHLYYSRTPATLTQQSMSWSMDGTTAFINYRSADGSFMNRAQVTDFGFHDGMWTGTYTATYPVKIIPFPDISAASLGAFYAAVAGLNGNEPGTTNLAPTVTTISGPTINQDSVTGALTFTIGDDATAAGSLIITGTSSNTNLVPNANIVFGGTGANRTVTITPAANQTGRSTIRVTVTDQSGAAVHTDFILTVLPQAPANVVATAIAETRVDVTWTAVTNMRYLVFRDNSSTPLTPTPITVNSYSDTSVTAGSTYTYRIQAVDAADISSNLSVAVSVTTPGAPAAPTIDAILDQVINEDSSTLTIPVSLQNLPASGNYQISVSAANATLLPASGINFQGTGAQRTLVLTPAANRFGETNVTVTLTVGSLVVTKTFRLTVTSVNDAPTIAAITPKTITVGGSLSNIPFTVGDIETAADALTVTRSSSNTALVPDANIVIGGSGANRTLSLTTAAGQTVTVPTQVTITITVSDGTTTTSITFVLTVRPPDTEAPTPPTNLQATPNSGYAVYLWWGAGSDNVGITGYRVFRDGVFIATVSGRSLTSLGLSPNTQYTYTVQAIDAAGNLSGFSNEVTVTTRGA